MSIEMGSVISCHGYSFWAKNRGLLISILFGIGVILFTNYSVEPDYSVKQIVFMSSFWAIVTLFYLWSDYKLRHQFVNIVLRENGLEFKSKENTRWVDWSSIVGLTEFGAKLDITKVPDKHYANSLHSRGIKIQLDAGDEVVIYKKINDYKKLENGIMKSLSLN